MTWQQKILRDLTKRFGFKLGVRLEDMSVSHHESGRGRNKPKRASSKELMMAIHGCLVGAGIAGKEENVKDLHYFLVRTEELAIELFDRIPRKGMETSPKITKPLG